MSVSRISSSAPTSTATWAARKSLSPKEISSVAVVSFSLITGSTRHSEQRRQRLARVQVVGAGAHVEERQQHLRAGHAALAQQLVVDPVELALPDRAGGLQRADRGRPLRQLHHAHAARDRAAGDDDHLAALRDARAASWSQTRASTSMRSAPSLSATTLEPSLTTMRLMAGAYLGRCRRLGSSAAGSSSKATPPISISSPGSKPSCLQRPDHADPPQPPLEVGHRVLVVDVVARQQPLDAAPAHGEGARSEALDA